MPDCFAGFLDWFAGFAFLWFDVVRVSMDVVGCCFRLVVGGNCLVLRLGGVVGLDVL